MMPRCSGGSTVTCFSAPYDVTALQRARHNLASRPSSVLGIVAAPRCRNAVVATSLTTQHEVHKFAPGSCSEAVERSSGGPATSRSHGPVSLSPLSTRFHHVSDHQHRRELLDLETTSRSPHSFVRVTHDSAQGATHGAP